MAIVVRLNYSCEHTRQRCPPPPKTMTRTYDLTEKELKLAESGEICFNNFQCPELGYQHFDGDPAFKCFTLEEALETGFTKHQVAGLISSLEAKGVIDIEHRCPMVEGPDLYWLSESFINYLTAKNQKEAN